MTARGGGQTANVDQVLIIPTQEILSWCQCLGYQPPLCTQEARINPPRAREVGEPSKRAAFAAEDGDEISVAQRRRRSTGRKLG